jgi:hypothetical protein
MPCGIEVLLKKGWMMQDVLAMEEMITMMMEVVEIHSLLGMRRTRSHTSCRNMKEITI